MGTTASVETQQPGNLGETKKAENQPISPEIVHDETATSIAGHLNEAKYPATPESVKSEHTFKPSVNLENMGIQPSSGDTPFKDVLRVITEELDSTASGTKRIVTGKGVDAVDMARGKQHKRGRLARLGNKFGFGKAA